MQERHKSKHKSGGTNVFKAADVKNILYILKLKMKFPASEVSNELT